MSFTINSSTPFNPEWVSESSDDTVEIIFDPSLEQDALIKNVTALYEREEQVYNMTKVCRVSMVLKNHSTENIIAVLKLAMNRLTLVDTSSIININLVINGYNSLEDEVTNNSYIFSNNIEQIVDIQLELASEIAELKDKIVYWYLACIRSAHKVEYTYLDQAVNLDNLYKLILMTNNVMNISRLIFNSKEVIDLGKLPLINEAYNIVMNFSATSAINNTFLNLLLNKFGNDLNTASTEN